MGGRIKTPLGATNTQGDIFEDTNTLQTSKIIIRIIERFVNETFEKVRGLKNEILNSTLGFICGS